MTQSALTDGATLISAAKALGLVGLDSNSRQIFDIHLANLAKLVEDIVFFDQVRFLPSKVAAINLTSRFGEALSPLVVPSKKERFLVSETRAKANALTTLSDIYEVLELIPYGSVHTHHDLGGSRSLDYLVFQALGVRGKYTELMKALIYEPGALNNIFSFRQDTLPFRNNAWNYQGKWLNSETDEEVPEVIGTPIPDKDVQDFTRKLLWTYFRTNYYFIVAGAYDLTYSPHSIRSQLLKYVILKNGAPWATGRDKAASVTVQKEIMLFLRSEAEHSLEPIRSFYNTTTTTIKYSPIFVHVFSKAKQRRFILEEAYKVRESKEAKAFRSRCREITDAFESGEINLLAKLKREIEQVTRNLAREHGLEPTGTELEAKIGFGPFALTKKAKLPRFVFKQIFIGKGHLVFVRNIHRDLLRISRLDKVYDDLFSDLLKHT